MKALFTFIFVQVFNYGISQIYIEPVLGLDLMYLRSGNSSFYFNANLFKNASGVIGFKIEKKLGTKYYLSYNFSYTSKEVEAGTLAIAPISLIKFSFNSNKISLKSYISNRSYLGLGINFDFMNNVKYYYNEIQRVGGVESISGKGIHFSIGTKYKNFDLELLFNFGLTSYIPAQALPSPIFYKVKPVQSIGLNFSYDIKLGDD